MSQLPPAPSDESGGTCLHNTVQLPLKAPSSFLLLQPPELSTNKKIKPLISLATKRCHPTIVLMQSGETAGQSSWLEDILPFLLLLPLRSPLHIWVLRRPDRAIGNTFMKKLRVLALGASCEHHLLCLACDFSRSSHSGSCHF